MNKIAVVEWLTGKDTVLSAGFLVDDGGDVVILASTMDSGGASDVVVIRKIAIINITMMEIANDR